jgi:hypothetical protein
MKNFRCPTWVLILLIITGLFAAICAACSEDALPPVWRGQPNTTTLHIAFPDASNPAQGVVLHAGGFATGWRESILMRANVWDLGQAGYITISMPVNAVRVRFQATYWTDIQIYNGVPVLSNGAELLGIVEVQPWFIGAWVDSVWEWAQIAGPVLVDLSVPYPKGFVLSDLVIDVEIANVVQSLAESNEDSTHE